MPQGTAQIILEDFDAYLQAFKRITQKAKERFEKQAWKLLQKDAADRVEAYELKVNETLTRVIDYKGNAFKDPSRVAETKQAFSNLIQFHTHSELAETYFNSISRKLLDRKSANSQTLFLEPGAYPRLKIPPSILWNTIQIDGHLKEHLSELLNCYPLKLQWENKERDLDLVTEKLLAHKLAKIPGLSNIRIEALVPIFYRNRGAYIIGRMLINGIYSPLVIALLINKEGKLFIDTLITSGKYISVLFSFSRSAFMVDLPQPATAVSFLQSVMPWKKKEELYNSIGYHRHGKTVFYRNFLHHLQVSNDELMIAPGTKGMVMIVFTLPSYNVVFKVMKNHFDPPKEVTHQEVRKLYKMVTSLDRVGRMAETHEFNYFSFPKNRFSAELLEELKKLASNNLIIEDDQILIKHLYIVRRMIPLNIFLEKADLASKTEAIIGYGNAIKELAASNIFPGDMLLKNFGITRNNRIVFYDYDEVKLLTDCVFREVPKPKNQQDVYQAENWFAVHPDDIFPELFANYLLTDPELKAMFLKYHPELLSADYWNDLKAMQLRKEVPEIFPYPKKLRFINQY